MTSALKGVALLSAIFLTSQVASATASTCTSSWPMACVEGNGRFLTGTAEIEGWIDATKIGMSAREPYRLTFKSQNVTEGTLYGKSAWASLVMDQGGNSVESYNDSATYDGSSSNAILADAPFSQRDRFGGGVSLVPSVNYPGKIIQDYSLANLDLDLRAAQTVLWPDSLPADTSTAQAGSFNLSIGFYGLDIDDSFPESYDIDPDDYVLLSTSNFERLRFTFQDEEGEVIATRDLTMAAAVVPLPGSVLFLLVGMGGLAVLRRRKSTTL